MGFICNNLKNLKEVTIFARFFIKKHFDFENSYVQNSFDDKLYLKKQWVLSKSPFEGSHEVVINSSGERIYLKPDALFKRPFNVTLMTLEVIGILLFIVGCLLLSKQLSGVWRVVVLSSLLLVLRFGLLIF